LRKRGCAKKLYCLPYASTPANIKGMPKTYSAIPAAPVASSPECHVKTSPSQHVTSGPAFKKYVPLAAWGLVRARGGWVGDWD